MVLSLSDEISQADDDIYEGRDHGRMLRMWARQQQAWGFVCR